MQFSVINFHNYARISFVHFFFVRTTTSDRHSDGTVISNIQSVLICTSKVTSFFEDNRGLLESEIALVKQMVYAKWFQQIEEILTFEFAALLNIFDTLLEILELFSAIVSRLSNDRHSSEYSSSQATRFSIVLGSAESPVAFTAASTDFFENPISTSCVISGVRGGDGQRAESLFEI